MADHFASSVVSTRQTYSPPSCSFSRLKELGRFEPGRNAKWNRKFPEFPNFRKKGQPPEVVHNFRNEFPETFCSIWFCTGISRNFGQMDRATYVIYLWRDGNLILYETGEGIFVWGPWHNLGKVVRGFKTIPDSAAVKFTEKDGFKYCRSVRTYRKCSTRSWWEQDTNSKNGCYKITKIVRTLWLAERRGCMRVCNHGCDVTLSVSPAHFKAVSLTLKYKY